MKNAKKAEQSKKKTIEAQEQQTKAPEAPAPAGTATTTPKKTAKTKAEGSKRERVIALAANISALRSELKRVEAEFDAALGSPSPSSSGSKAKESGTSMAARILQAMGSDKEKTFTAAGLAQAMGTDIVKVRSALYGMLKGGRVARGERGQYRPVQP